MCRTLTIAAVSLAYLTGAMADPVAVPAGNTGAVSSQGTDKRVVGLTGAPNFRDIGGYATADGRHVRWGVVYRSNKLSALTADDEAKLDSLHIVSEIDLRTLEERQSEPSRWLHQPADIYDSPKQSLGPDLGSLLSQVHDAASAHAAIDGFYARMPDLYRAEYAAFFQHLLDHKEPLVVHCTAGKDRTGVASAILLSALNVPRATVVSDYALTEQLLPPPPRANGATQQAAANVPKSLAALNQLPEDARVEMWRSEPAYIMAALNSIDQEYGSVDGYLKTGLGLSDDQIAQLRASLTE